VLTRGPSHLSTHHESLRGHGWRSGLRLALVQDLLDGGRCLIILQRAGVTLDVVTERRQLGDDLFVVELNAMGLELFGDFVDALLRHTGWPSNLLRFNSLAGP